MESSTLQPVNPVRPVAGYVGGKRNLSRRLVELIGRTPHRTYCEAFVGMGGVFLRRKSRPAVEVINDISGDVATLFRVLQEHYPYFVDMLRWRLTSRAEFERLLAIPGERLTDLQRAARFLYVQRTAFGGKVAGRNFGVSPQTPGRFDITKLEPMLADVHERLAGVVIERLGYADFITRYDRPETLFYLDPPYFGCEDDYGLGVFSEADFERLRDLLEQLKGRFILSINDRPEVRAIFSQFEVEEVGLNYRISGQVTAARELIISGPA
jgi:DNA adenine methylase